jgi:hypothetical protein
MTPELELEVPRSQEYSRRIIERSTPPLFRELRACRNFTLVPG